EAARGLRRTFHNSALIPYPKNKVQVTISTRDRENIFREIYSIVIDPNSHQIKKDRPYRNSKVHKLLYNGEPSKKVDLLFIGDGYAKNEMEKLQRDARRFMEILFMHSPFKEKRDMFNVFLIEAASEESGPDDPRKGIFRSTVVGTSFNTFDSARYLTTTENRLMRDIASNSPYDAIFLMVNTSQYGGGGIYNLYSVFATDNEYDAYLIVHEFGHAFAGLGDEYYTSQISYSDFYPAGVEPWEPNITALLDRENVKWKILLTPGIPIPTPEDREKFGKVVGCFEGAGYAAKGLYRPMIDCKMFSKGFVDFCPVCSKAISDMIDFYCE
ncbi:MAG: M64 family metallopeptidase, partial [Acidobacteriota bacterium]